jgi:hypothetical protein
MSRCTGTNHLEKKCHDHDRSVDRPRRGITKRPGLRRRHQNQQNHHRQRHGRVENTNMELQRAYHHPRHLSYPTWVMVEGQDSDLNTQYPMHLRLPIY